MTDRRELLASSVRLAGVLAALGCFPGLAAATAGEAAGWNASAFDAKSMAELVAALGAGAPVASAEVSVTGPDIAENGAVVPVGAATTLPGVRRMLLVVEKNPSVLSAVFEVNDAVEPNFSTRVKMAQSSNVYAVAVMDDGRLLYAAKEVKVTLGGCGG